MQINILYKNEYWIKERLIVAEVCEQKNNQIDAIC